MKRKIFSGLVITAALAGIIFFAMPERFQKTPSGAPSVIELRFALPQGFTFTAGAPYKLTCSSDNPAILGFSKNCAENFSPFKPPFRIPVITNPGTAKALLTGTFYYCEQSSDMCFSEKFETSLTAHIKDTSPAVISHIWNLWPAKKSTDHRQ
jgi:hypothetical protein